MTFLTFETTGMRLTIVGLLAISTLLSGLWLSRTGTPYNTWFFNLHKLIAVTMIVVLGVNALHLTKSLELQTFLTIAGMVLSGVLLLALVATGGMLSLDVWPRFSLRVHQVVPLLAVAASLFTLYMLGGYQA